MDSDNEDLLNERNSENINNEFDPFPNTSSFPETDITEKDFERIMEIIKYLDYNLETIKNQINSRNEEIKQIELTINAKPKPPQSVIDTGKNTLKDLNKEKENLVIAQHRLEQTKEKLRLNCDNSKGDNVFALAQNVCEFDLRLQKAPDHIKTIRGDRPELEIKKQAKIDYGLDEATRLDEATYIDKAFTAIYRTRDSTNIYFYNKDQDPLIVKANSIEGSTGNSLAARKKIMHDDLRKKFIIKQCDSLGVLLKQDDSLNTNDSFSADIEQAKRINQEIAGLLEDREKLRKYNGKFDLFLVLGEDRLGFTEEIVDINSKNSKVEDERTKFALTGSTLVRAISLKRPEFIRATKVYGDPNDPHKSQAIIEIKKVKPENEVDPRVVKVIDKSENLTDYGQKKDAAMKFAKALLMHYEFGSKKKIVIEGGKEHKEQAELVYAALLMLTSDDKKYKLDPNLIEVKVEGAKKIGTFSTYRYGTLEAIKKYIAANELSPSAKGNIETEKDDLTEFCKKTRFTESGKGEIKTTNKEDILPELPSPPSH
ncbi:MAG: hypothetical protein A3E88_02835 [Legionellales bacterium RIFCSPHIGHO2_12_FULL_35_11]|nr:MAG: hypothetical protein A3E88_02835 [Legionellales bacterium RIFCSPHIGHO2_12_FULL_35_11]